MHATYMCRPYITFRVSYIGSKHEQVAVNIRLYEYGHGKAMK